MINREPFMDLLIRLFHHCDHGGVVEPPRQGLRPTNPAHGGAAHGIEEGLQTLLITAFRRVAGDVLHLSLIHI